MIKTKVLALFLISTSIALSYAEEKTSEELSIPDATATQGQTSKLQSEQQVQSEQTQSSADTSSTESTDLEVVDITLNDESGDDDAPKTYGGVAVVPAAKRPKKPTSEEIAEAEKTQNSKSENYEQKMHDTFKFGIDSEISESIDSLLKNKDKRFVDDIYDLFQVSESSSVKETILKYFTELKDPCLEDYAVEIANDPYDMKNSTVSLVLKYLGAVECKAAAPAVVAILESENESYFDDALTALGSIGGDKEAVFLAEYLDRDDLSNHQKQELMKVLGKLKAVATWDKLRDVVENEDENSYVRMYAAEAIGAMEKTESIDVLIQQFQDTSDPNLRVYIVKGLSYFSTTEVQNVLVQAVRDDYYKVRLEAIEAVKKQKITSAVPYLIYRAKNDKESAVKYATYPVIAMLNTSEGNEYLVSLITDKKSSDTVKSKVAACLLEENNAGTSEIIELARDTLKNDVHKNLRYALGKEFAKYEKSDFASICEEYLSSSDVSTQGTGLDIYAKGRYSSCKDAVQKIADMRDKKGNPKGNAKKAMRILGLTWDEESKTAK
ncbi:MAG: HEAT repeat domain-containing protein [Treponema sp.]|nr:HEAT repeat domain-containing protein [Treponema sp.]